MVLKSILLYLGMYVYMNGGTLPPEQQNRVLHQADIRQTLKVKQHHLADWQPL